MQDADATGELAPTGRISVHEDVNNDGVYEKHGVFVDKLVFPRFVMPIGGNAILTMESNPDEVWKYTDTNGDCGRGQEGVVHDELRTRRQRRAPAEQPVLGHGQLAVQHLQRLPRPVDADRRAQGTDRAQQRAVGHHAGQHRPESGSKAAPAGFPATSSCRSTTA